MTFQGKAVPCPTPSQVDTTVWEKLEEVGRWAETQPCTLPRGLAANDDYYLHGRPKKA